MLLLRLKSWSKSLLLTLSLFLSRQPFLYVKTALSRLSKEAAHMNLWTEIQRIIILLLPTRSAFQTTSSQGRPISLQAIQLNITTYDPETSGNNDSPPKACPVGMKYRTGVKCLPNGMLAIPSGRSMFFWGESYSSGVGGNYRTGVYPVGPEDRTGVLS